MRSNPATTLASAALGATSPQYSEQIGQTVYLPSGVIFAEGSVLSPLLSNTAPAEQDREGVLKRATNVTFKSISFQADGSTNIATLMPSGAQPGQSYITLVEEVPGAEPTEIPTNFFAVQIDPSTGKATTYRP
jgi:hypothetical protein